MGFIKHALIGIVLYEVVKYMLKNEVCGFAHEWQQSPSTARKQVHGGDVDVSARQTGRLQQMKKNSASGLASSVSEGLVGRPNLTDPHSKDDFAVGSDPETPLAGQQGKDHADPWEKSLANDEVRAPDS